uniref:Putative ankyrin repeat protein n=1 Tax=Nyssomyia neivai TaxID=330878 RepID=A0A1L8DAR9_9DIPT
MPSSKCGVPRRFACSCCPYGYHIDLDFVKYVESLGKIAPISRRARSARRQRHSMDIMMGFTAPPVPERTDSKGREFDAVCATDALADAVCKFELTLLSTAGPAPVETSNEDVEDHEESKIRAVEESKVRAVEESKIRAVEESKVRKLEESKIRALEDAKIRALEEYAYHQMAQHLNKIKSLEEQLKVIPALQLQIEMLTEDKRRLEKAARRSPARTTVHVTAMPRLSCARDVGSQCVPNYTNSHTQHHLLQTDASTATEVKTMATVKLQSTPDVKSRITQTSEKDTRTQATNTEVHKSDHRDAWTLTEVVEIPLKESLPPVRVLSVSKSSQTEKKRLAERQQQTEVVRQAHRQLQVNIQPPTSDVRMQTDCATATTSIGSQVVPDAANTSTQTEVEKTMHMCTQTQHGEIHMSTQTDELLQIEIEDIEDEEDVEDAVDVDEESEDSSEESMKSPLSAINEDTEERETYTSGTTRDSEEDNDEPAKVMSPSREMLVALACIADALQRNVDVQTIPHANATARREWFSVASTEGASAASVRAYLAAFSAHSADVVTYMARLADANGNTALHYAISHGNFAVVNALLDCGACDVDRCNNAGYTAIMLVSLVGLHSVESRRVVERLFRVADINLRARKHGQTALMLAVSHGNANMVSTLLAAGADVNSQDEDGSTALMCAVEHGKMDIVKLLLAHPSCDSSIQDMDGSTALKISLDAGFHDIGILLYAHGRASRHRNGAV